MQRLSFPDEQSMHEKAAELLSEGAHRSIVERGRFSVALSGGSTPRRTHELLCRKTYMDDAAWARTFVFWGDERMVPLDSEYSNCKMAVETLLDHVPVPENNVYPMPVDNGPGYAVDVYEAQLAEVLGPGTVLDFCFLGMGSDGHTASLFPGSPILDESVKLVAYEPSPGLPPKVPRLTMTLPMINRARNVVFLVSGREKGRIADEIFRNFEAAGDKYPAARIRPQGRLIWLTA